ncbi:MAG: hypothetical protein HKN42_13285 [Granulosicoccus sp.]|nr:hypothetical protein [Granulosicoccus sp.]
MQSSTEPAATTSGRPLGHLPTLSAALFLWWLILQVPLIQRLLSVLIP